MLLKERVTLTRTENEMLARRLMKLENKVNEIQRTIIPNEIEYKYEKAINALKGIYDHCHRQNLAHHFDPINIPKIKRLDAIKDFVIEVLKELGEPLEC